MFNKKLLYVINYDNKMKSLFDIINFTYTSMGKRLLKFNLCNPICDIKILNNRYDKIDIINNNNLKIDENLKQIIDIERLHRRLGLKMLQPADFGSLDTSYIYILKMLDFQDEKLDKLKPSHETINLFKSFIEEYHTDFDLDTDVIQKKIVFNYLADVAHLVEQFTRNE